MLCYALVLRWQRYAVIDKIRSTYAMRNHSINKTHGDMDQPWKPLSHGSNSTWRFDGLLLRPTMLMHNKYTANTFGDWSIFFSHSGAASSEGIESFSRQECVKTKNVMLSSHIMSQVIINCLRLFQGSVDVLSAHYVKRRSSLQLPTTVTKPVAKEPLINGSFNSSIFRLNLSIEEIES